MTFRQTMQAARDYWRPNRRELKPFLLQDGKKHPVAIICPGGGYTLCCSFIEGEPFARELNKRGYSAVVVYYRCREKARFPAPMDDLAWAIREVLNHAQEWNLEVENYSVWGSSAGGHLAASFGTESMGYLAYGLPKPGAIILSYPVITMGELTHAGSRDNLLGKNPAHEEIGHLLGQSPTEEAIRKLSIEHQVTEKYPPAFVWYGEADDLVPPENSRLLQEALQQHGVPCELVHYANVGHGVGLGRDLPCRDWFERAVAFWEKQSAGRA